MVSSDLPIVFKYWIVFTSTGKYPMVAPYSGDMFAIVARSTRLSSAHPGPKNSTNLPTTPLFLSILVQVRTRSVAVV